MRTTSPAIWVGPFKDHFLLISNPASTGYRSLQAGGIISSKVFDDEFNQQQLDSKGTGNVGYIGLFGKTTTELDFAEVAGKSPRQTNFTQHYGADDQQDVHTWTGGDSSDDFRAFDIGDGRLGSPYPAYLDIDFVRVFQKG